MTTTAPVLEAPAERTFPSATQDEIDELLVTAASIGQTAAGERGRLATALEDIHAELDEHDAGMTRQHDEILAQMCQVMLDEYQSALGLVDPSLLRGER